MHVTEYQSTEALEQRRAELALDSRTDPSLRADLAEVEAELTQRRLDADRDAAAAGEDARRADQERDRLALAERSDAQAEFDRLGLTMAMAARTIELHVRELLEMVAVLVGEAVLREDAARRAGIDWSAMRIGSMTAGRVGHALSRGGGLPFAQLAPGGPVGAFARPLDELLGVKPDA